MNYRELKEKHQRTYNAFPIGFAFNKEQYAEVVETIGKGDEANLVSIKGGGLIHKDDTEQYKAMIRTFIDEEAQYIGDDEERMQEAIEYTMRSYGFTFEEALWRVGNNDKPRDEEKIERIRAKIFKRQTPPPVEKFDITRVSVLARDLHFGMVHRKEEYEQILKDPTLTADDKELFQTRVEELGRMINDYEILYSTLFQYDTQERGLLERNGYQFEPVKY